MSGETAMQYTAHQYCLCVCVCVFVCLCVHVAMPGCITHSVVCTLCSLNKVWYEIKCTVNEIA